MAYSRSISKRASLIARQRFPSFSYAICDDERKNHYSLDEGRPQPKISNFVQQRFFGSGLNGSAGFGAFVQNRRCSHFSPPPGIGSSLCRYMSTSEGSANVEFMSDVDGVIAETVQEVASQVPAVNEVAVAAADSFYNVAALQHIIDAVHGFTGFNWWASIAVTTLLIRTATVPLLINQMKVSTKLMALRPQIEELGNEIKAKGPMGSIDSQKKLKALYAEHGVSPFTPLRGIFIQAPIFASFFFAISNMAEKVPSFKNGGALWFTDLSTPDTLYILPVIMSVTFLIMVESNMQEGMEGSPAAGIMKVVSRAFAVLTVPFTMGFPKAIFCYWITSNIFSLIYGSAIKPPAVRKYLGLPERIVTPPSTTPKPSLSVFESLKQLTERRNQVAAEQANPMKPMVPSSSVTSQRYKKIERDLRRRIKRNKRQTHSG